LCWRSEQTSPHPFSPLISASSKKLAGKRPTDQAIGDRLFELAEEQRERKLQARQLAKTDWLRWTPADTNRLAPTDSN
jgi:hypothetical protein